MKCTNCGALIEDGKLFCPICGTEVQLVPDYYSMEALDYVNQHKKEEEQKKKRQRQEEEAMLQAEEEARNRKKKIWIAVGVSACLVFVILFFVCYNFISNRNSYEYQLNKAETLYSGKNYEEALVYAERALALDRQSAEAKFLLAQIYLNTDHVAEAVATLESILAKQPEYEAAYGLLIQQYEIQEKFDQIKELLDACKDDKIRKKFAEYICEKPLLSLVEGEYSEPQTLYITSEKETDYIFYTLDGSEPNGASNQYTGPITITEGTTIVKIVAWNEKGIKSDLVSVTYIVNIDAPDAPTITPTSGSYSSDMGNTKIYVIVPDGCKAYYSFDKPATIHDEPYLGPVEMPEGEHTFYAILVNEHGKVSVAGSATYIYKVIEEIELPPADDTTGEDTDTQVDAETQESNTEV